jgi:hypothetical protein
MGGVVGVLLAQIQLARALIKKELQIKKFFSHPLHIFSTPLFYNFNIKKNFGTRFPKFFFALETNFGTYFLKIFPNLN